MKLKLIAITAVGALSLASSALANDPEAGQGQSGGRGHRHSPLDRISDRLELTAQQKTQVQPIMDQAAPQLETIRREAMEKTKAVMDNAKAQIRPLLTPEQQKKLDEMKDERRGGRERGGHGGRHGDHGQGGQDDQDNG